jgi:hypothetical protein
VEEIFMLKSTIQRGRAERLFAAAKTGFVLGA